MPDMDSEIDVCVHLSSGTIAPGVSVNYSLEYIDEDADQVSSINPTMGGFIAGSDSVCHTITVNENDVVEPDGTIIVRIINSSLIPPNTTVNMSEAEVTVINDDRLMVLLFLSRNTISEGGSVALAVNYTGFLQQESAISLDLLTILESGEASDDDYDLYITTGNTLSTPFPVSLSTSTRQQLFTVEATDDLLLEDLEETLSFSISLTSSDLLVEVDSTYGTQELTITDNEQLRFSFEESSYTISEEFNGSHPLYVVIENFNTSVRIPESPVSITLSVMVGPNTNATEGTDYDIGRYDLTFRSNTFQGAVDIDFVIEYDELVEGHEVVYLSLTQPVINNLVHPNGAVLGATRNTIVTISDDDEITVGFTRRNHTGDEGSTLSVCIMIFEGILAPEVTLAYLITAPREDPALPVDSMPDTAMGRFVYRVRVT